MRQGCPYQSHNLGWCQHLLCSGGLAHTTMCLSEGFNYYFLTSMLQPPSPCPQAWLSTGPISRQSSARVSVHVGTQLPAKRNFCLQHIPKKLSAYLMDSRSAPMPPEKSSLKMDVRHALFACMWRNCWLPLPADTVRTAAQTPLSLLLRPPRTHGGAKKSEGALSWRQLLLLSWRTEHRAKVRCWYLGGQYKHFQVQVV